MNKVVVYRIAAVLLVFVLQVLMCNRIALWGYATPFLVVYLFLKIPSGARLNIAMTFAFFVGLCIDIFTGTLGVYALASVTAVFPHHYLINRVQYREREEESFTPSAEILGWGGYTLYAALITAIFCVVLFCIDSFSFFAPAVLLGRIVGSTAFTLLIVLCIEIVSRRK